MVLLVVFISASAIVIFMSPHAQSMTDFLQQTLVDTQPTIPQAIITQVCVVSIFLSLINTWLSISCSAVASFLVVFFAMIRGIPLAEIEAERNLSKEEAERVKRA